MTVMERAHQIRKYEAFQLQGMSYRQQMSVCLKKAHKEAALKKYNEEMKTKAIKRLLLQKEMAKTRMIKAQEEEIKNREPYQPKDFFEMDLAIAAYNADQRDINSGLKVRAW